MPADPMRILIVDDDLDFADAVSCVLRAEGFAVLRAADGRSALKVALLERPDLILMDIMMGERTEGLFTIQEMRRREELKQTPIFILSSLYEEVPEFRVRPEATRLDHDEFFPKPVDTARLVAKIRARLGPVAPAPHAT